MERTIRSTSIEVYYKNQELLSALRWKVYECLWCYGPMGQNEACIQLGVERLEMSSYMPRFAELKHMGAIEIVGERKCRIKPKNTVTIWDITGRVAEKWTRKKRDPGIKDQLISKISEIYDKHKGDMFIEPELKELYNLINQL